VESAQQWNSHRCWALPGAEIESQREGQLLTILAKPGEGDFPGGRAVLPRNKLAVKEPVGRARPVLDEVFRRLTAGGRGIEKSWV